MNSFNVVFAIVCVSIVCGCIVCGCEYRDARDATNDALSESRVAADTNAALRHRTEDDTAGLLLPIREDGLYGYVTTEGAVQIAPRFRAAGLFADGLAAVREHGRYGYIDRNGNWAIQPLYDYATTFSEGLAVGVIDSIAYLLHTNGSALRVGVFDGASPFRDGLAIFRKSHDFLILHYDSAVVNKYGEVLVDTRRDGDFELVDSSHILVSREMHWRKSPRHVSVLRTSLIDTHGSVLKTFTGHSDCVVRYGAPRFVLRSYDTIRGSAMCDMYDVRGSLVVRLSPTLIDDIDNIQASGFVLAHGHGNSHHGFSRYWRILDSLGNTVFMDGNWEGTFSESLAFSFDRSRRLLYVYDLGTRVRQLHRLSANDIDIQSHNLALISTDVGSIVMNQYGDLSRPLALPSGSEILYDGSERIVGMHDAANTYYQTLLFFEKRTSRNPIVTIDSVRNVSTLTHGFVSASLNHHNIVIRPDGKIIWRGNSSTFGKRNVTTGVSSYDDHVSCSPTQTDYDYRPIVARFGDPDSAKPITAHLETQLRKRNLQLSTDAQRPIQLFAYIERKQTDSNVHIVMVNTSNENISIETNSSRLIMQLQARRKSTDHWQDIEYLPSSTCGNGWYSVSMPAKHYWSFDATRYTGSDDVECRVRLRLEEPFIVQREKRNYPVIVYSNTFHLSVNPAQLWRTIPHE